MFQYNPVKKRIYLITNECALLHIFELNDDGIVEWWTDTVGRLGNLTYIKAIAIPGDGATIANIDRENYTIDFDLNTGEERAIIQTRLGYASVTGSITRIPWRE